MILLINLKEFTFYYFFLMNWTQIIHVYTVKKCIGILIILKKL